MTQLDIHGPGPEGFSSHHQMTLPGAPAAKGVLAKQPRSRAPAPPCSPSSKFLRQEMLATSTRQTSPQSQGASAWVFAFVFSTDESQDSSLELDRGEGGQITTLAVDDACSRFLSRRL